MKTLTEAKNEIARKHGDESVSSYLPYLINRKWVMPKGDDYRNCDVLFHDGHMLKMSKPLTDTHGNFRGFVHYYRSIYQSNRAFIVS